MQTREAELRGPVSGGLQDPASEAGGSVFKSLGSATWQAV